MNKFCVGQKVIDCLNDRKLLTVVKTFKSGQIELDNGTITYNDRVQCQERYLDKTSFFYHHSKFGDGQQMAREGFVYYKMALDDLEDLAECGGDSVFLMRARSYAEATLKDAAERIEQGLAWKRTAEHNLAQWDRLTLDHHFPFLNPENLIDY